jgi:hypothetical protein
MFNRLILQRAGATYADNPALTPMIYDPLAPAGQRFSSDGIPATTIARMYHSTASLTPNGSIMLGVSLHSSSQNDERADFLFQPDPTQTMTLRQSVNSLRSTGTTSQPCLLSESNEQY